MTEMDRRAMLRGVVGIGALLGASVTAAPEAFAAVPAPTILGCDMWDARPASSAISVVDHRPTYITVHNTETPNTDDVSEEHARVLARSIQNFHMDTRGWADTGQHLTLSRGGYVLEGRHRSLAVLRAGRQHVLGAHTLNWNDKSFGIECEGTYMTATPPARQWGVLVDLCAYVCHQYGIGVDAIKGHRDFSGNNTDCPGDELHSLLPRLRREVTARLG